MSDYTLEQKLAILEKMKQEQAKNEFSLGKRNRFTGNGFSDSLPDLKNSSGSGTTRSLGRLRFLFAFFLLAGYFILHFTGFSYKTFYAKAIETMVSESFSKENATQIWKSIEKNLDLL